MTKQDAINKIDELLSNIHLEKLEIISEITTFDYDGNVQELMEYAGRKYDAARPKKGQHNFSLNNTDVANAEYFTETNKDSLRYDHRRERWLHWSGQYWIEDKNGFVFRLAKDSIRKAYIQAFNISDTKEAGLRAKWLIGSEQRPRQEAIIALSRNYLPIADSGIDFDTNPWLLAVKNGIIDLKTGTMRDGKPDDRITQHTDIEYIPDSPKPARFILFLNEIFNYDQQLIDWILRALAYCLTGLTREQIIFILYGTGANGKSKLLEIMRYILGDYSYNSPFSTFELNSRAAIPNDIAALERRRFVTSLETQDGTRLNEPRIKMLSGEDDVTARYLRQEFFTFKPVCKLWLGVNHKPKVDDDSYGFWRRVRLIPFTQQFTGSNEDKNLINKLIAEAPGILNLLVKYCLIYQEKGLSDIPESISQSTADYKTESDPLAQFIRDTCDETPGSEAQAADLYKAYQSWCDNQGLTQKERFSNTSFGRRLSNKYPKNRTINGIYYQGIFLKSDQNNVGFASVNVGLDLKSNLLPITNSHEGNNTVNPTQPYNPTSKDKNFPVDILEFWSAKGKPIIHLGNGENCEDLKKLLRHGVNERQEAALLTWYKKNKVDLLNTK